MRSLVGEREVGACIRDVCVVLLGQAPLMRRTPDGAKTRSRKSWYEQRAFAKGRAAVDSTGHCDGVTSHTSDINDKQRQR
jgi:hypothetical protein